MGRPGNAAQANLRLLFQMLAGVALLLFSIKNLISYLKSSGSLTSLVALAALTLALLRKFQQWQAKCEQEALLLQHQAIAAEIEVAWERSRPQEIERRREARPAMRQIAAPPLQPRSPRQVGTTATRGPGAADVCDSPVRGPVGVVPGGLAVAASRAVQELPPALQASVPVSQPLQPRNAPLPSGASPATPATAAPSAAPTAKKKKKKKVEEAIVVEDELEAEVVEDLEDFLQHSRLRSALKSTAGVIRESQRRQEEKRQHQEELRQLQLEEQQRLEQLPEPTKPEGNSEGGILRLPSPSSVLPPKPAAPGKQRPQAGAESERREPTGTQQRRGERGGGPAKAARDEPQEPHGERRSGRGERRSSRGEIGRRPVGAGRAEARPRGGGGDKSWEQHGSDGWWGDGWAAAEDEATADGTAPNPQEAYVGGANEGSPGFGWERADWRGGGGWWDGWQEWWGDDAVWTGGGSRSGGGGRGRGRGAGRGRGGRGRKGGAGEQKSEDFAAEGAEAEGHTTLPLKFDFEDVDEGQGDDDDWGVYLNASESQSLTTTPRTHGSRWVSRSSGRGRGGRAGGQRGEEQQPGGGEGGAVSGTPGKRWVSKARAEPPGEAVAMPAQEESG
uniref:Uncharacterized protein n=1 Tax=Alexandrium monilatum TaxID=311494 RepID=A0A7S4VVY0_9DINO